MAGATANQRHSSVQYQKQTQTPSQPPSSLPSTKKKPTKFGSAFKKVGQYLQNQAQQNSHSALYLSPQDPYVVQQSQQTHFDKLTEEEILQHLAGLNNDHPSALPFGVIPPLSSNDGTPYGSTLTSMSEEAPHSGGASSELLSRIKRHQYASDNILQSYDVLIPERREGKTATTSNDDDPSDGYFLVFIHGGYFRDPKQTSKSFQPTISFLESDTATPQEITHKITGYASLNYRLAPHPGHPQSPTTPAYTHNVAHWPDQPNDIISALKHIHSHYPASRRYILSGHSVGATLSLIATLRARDSGLTPPAHVVGICGIYDFPLIHKMNDGYEGMTRGSMDQKQFGEASPALYKLGDYVEKWNGEAHTVMLAASKEDKLVNWEQMEGMAEVFDKQDGGERAREKIKSVVVEVEGDHYACLEDGGLARCLRELLGSV